MKILFFNIKINKRYKKFIKFLSKREKKMGKNCCKTIKKIIKECDCFGTFISFRINDEIEYKSLIGGFSTIIFTSFALAYTIYVSYYFISRKNVDLIYSNKIIQSNPKVNLTQLEFNFGFGLQYQSNGESAINLKYFKYNLSLCSLEKVV